LLCEQIVIYITGVNNRQLEDSTQRRGLGWLRICMDSSTLCCGRRHLLFL